MGRGSINVLILNLLLFYIWKGTWILIGTWKTQKNKQTKKPSIWVEEENFICANSHVQSLGNKQQVTTKIRAKKWSKASLSQLMLKIRTKKNNKNNNNKKPPRKFRRVATFTKLPPQIFKCILVGCLSSFYMVNPF